MSVYSIRSHAQTDGFDQGVINLDTLNVRAGGKLEALTAPDTAQKTLMVINATNVTVNGNGYFRTNNIHIIAKFVDVDLAGELHSDYSGEAVGEGLGDGLDKENYHLGMYMFISPI